MNHGNYIRGGLAALAIVALTAPGAGAADLPAATKKMLTELKVPESVVAGVEKELEVPAAWIEAAKKEGELRMVDTHSQKDFDKMVAPFRERYPFIKFNYSRGSYQNRTTRLMVAMKVGNYPSDIGNDFGGYYPQFLKAGFLADMRDLPGYNNVERKARGDDGTWIAHRRQFWCVSYNTNLVKKAELPKTWDGFLDNPRWRDGNIAVGNRPQLWILMLWGYHGPDYAKRYMARLFNEVKPQTRKEGMNALVALTIAGELPLAIPASEYRVELSQAKGAPVGYHCPEPVPATMASFGIFKGNPHPYASKLYANWLLSKEGQVAQYYASRSVPVHKDLQMREFTPFAEEILGKKIALREPKLIEDVSVEVQKIWADHWAAATGLGSIKTVSIKIEKVNKRGRTIDFKVKGKPETVSLSGRRSKITVGGKKARRSALKAGMACELTYRGSGDEAKSIACK